MRLDTGLGWLVRFNDKAGHDHERRIARDSYAMTAGQQMTVNKLRVEAWRSYVEFRELPGAWFNTVMFDNVDDSCPEIVISPRASDAIDVALAAYHDAVKPGLPGSPVCPTVPRQVADALALQLTALRNAGRADA